MFITAWKRYWLVNDESISYQLKIVIQKIIAWMYTKRNQPTTETLPMYSGQTSEILRRRIIET
jgi:hypothetical protein